MNFTRGYESKKYNNSYINKNKEITKRRKIIRTMIVITIEFIKKKIVEVIKTMSIIANWMTAMILLMKIKGIQINNRRTKKIFLFY